MKKKTKLRAAVVGCGAFMGRQNLRNLAASPEYSLEVLCDIDEALLRERAREFQPAHVTVSADEVFADPDVDVVFLGVKGEMNRHFIAEAVRYEKPIFVEKPMSATEEDTRAILRILRHKPHLLGVDFNRRYAPAMQAARRLFWKFRQGPAQVTYRIVDDHRVRPRYIFDVEGGSGGHILHEGCHIFDLLPWFLDEEPVKIYATGPLATDNTVLIEFSGGSTAALVCGGKGSLFYPKESLEVFCNHHSLVLDGFVELRCIGDDIREIRRFPTADKEGAYPHMSAYYESMFAAGPRGVADGDTIRAAFRHVVNKGHAEIVDAFGQHIRAGTRFPVGVEEGARATICALRAAESLRSGMPVRVSEADYRIPSSRSEPAFAGGSLA